MREWIHRKWIGGSVLTLVALACVFFMSTSAVAEARASADATQAASTKPVDIVRAPADVPAPVGSRAPAVVRVNLAAREVVGELDPASDTSYRYWTFNGKVPGPMIRARVGDTVQVTLQNDSSSHMVHSVDFHAAIGPGGGAAMSQVMPGQSKTFTFQATTPGLFVYHCGTPMIADHIANGMYGLILIEPAGGLPHVDREYYVMQGEIYTAAAKGKAGLQQFSEPKLLGEAPEYFVFNGAVDSLTKEHPLAANTGETVRIFFGNAGPNESSSLHVVGEIFTHDYQLGSLTSPPLTGVQTANVPPGAAAIVELKAEVPGQFNFMDHAMSRMAKGLMGVLDVKGNEVARLMYPGGASVTDGPPALAITKEDADALEVSSNPGSASASLPNSDTHSASSTLGENHSSPKEHDIGSRPAAPKRARGPVDSVELDGCLTSDGAMPKLTLFRSSKFYRLEPRAMLLNESPLLFANNINSVVHVTGRLVHMADTYDADHAPVFEVETMDQLAPSCDKHVSLARLLRAKRAQQIASATSGSATVTMGEMTFEPVQVQITAGQQVTWKNTSSVVHNVVADPAQALVAADVRLPRGAKPFASSLLQSGQTFARRFDLPGIYQYVCTLHEGNGMKGVVIVRPATPVNMAKTRSATQAEGK
jgi:copper-containing nitrite reductase